MYGVFSRPFDKLDSEDLADLVTIRKVREHINLDYKLEPYTHDHSGTVEMLADVTAMANARGGYILIGVSEDRAAPDGTPKELIGIERGDEETRWIQSVCFSSIDERIAGIRVRDILLPNGRSCIVIEIPNSVKKPHMVVHQRHRSFRIRHGRSKNWMGMQEVRDMILSMNQYQESLVEFLEGRKKAVRHESGGEPRLLLMVTPIYVNMEKVDPLRKELRDLLTNPPGIVDRCSRALFINRPEPTLFGVEAGCDRSEATGSYRRVLRLYRNGHLEHGIDLSRWRKAHSEGQEELPLSLYYIAATLLHFLETAKQVMIVGEVYEPVAVTVHLDNISPSYLLNRSLEFMDKMDIAQGKHIWREQSLTVSQVVSELTDREKIAQPIVEKIFNAFGYENNPFFDHEGKFVLKQ